MTRFNVLKYDCLSTATTQMSDTCQVMSNLAQFNTVFLANVTNKPDLAPECTASSPPCHGIACSSTDGSHYNVDISPCVSPPTFHLEIQRSGSPATFRHTYAANNRVTTQFNRSAHFQVTMSYQVNLIVLEVRPGLLYVSSPGSTIFSMHAILLKDQLGSLEGDKTSKKLSYFQHFNHSYYILDL